MLTNIGLLSIVGRRIFRLARGPPETRKLHRLQPAGRHLTVNTVLCLRRKSMTCTRRTPADAHVSKRETGSAPYLGRACALYDRHGIPARRRGRTAGRVNDAIGDDWGFRPFTVTGQSLV